MPPAIATHSENALACAIAAAVCAASAAVPVAAQELPSCDSTEVESLFIETINNSPAGLTRGLRGLGLEYGFEEYASKDGSIRLCTGWAHLNTGDDKYKILIEGGNNRKFYLHAMSDTDLRHKTMHLNKFSEKAIRDCVKEKTDENYHKLYCLDGLGMLLK